MEYARMRRQKVWIKRILILFLILTIAMAAGYFYFEVYLNQIRFIDSINITAKQNSKINVPEEVEVQLRNGKKKKMPVNWDNDIINTSKLGLVQLNGQVTGYNSSVTLNVRVYCVVEKVEVPEVLCIVDSNSLKLPDYVSVHYSMKTQGKEKVAWDMSKVNLKVPGKYEVLGRLLSNIECKEPVKCNIEVIDRNEAISRILVKNEFTSTPEVKGTIEKIKKLPGNILEMLVKSSIKINYVNKRITDIPEFSSLKEGKDSELRVFGVFKYPDIYVDFGAKDEMANDSIDSFDTITIHEIGHAYDYLYNILNNSEEYTISSTTRFYTAWKDEAKQLFSNKNMSKNNEYNNYYAESQYEYFAQSFAYYFTSEETRKFLEEKAPDSYRFMKNEVDK